jgi:two-component system, OmpR family, sensor kinase
MEIMSSTDNTTNSDPQNLVIYQDAVDFVDKVNDNIKNNFSLDTLSENLVLSMERSKIIYDLFEKNNSLLEQSENLTKALTDEKNISNLQAEFVSLVSHEFRTPLSIIKTSTELVERFAKDSPREEEISLQVSKIYKAVIRMNKLIEGTLNLSKLETGKLEFQPSSFCIGDLLEETTDRFRDINPEAEFVLEIHNKSLFFNGDRNLLDQVFTNLISNAIKYSHHKDQVRVYITCRVKDRNFIVSIKDEGIGMTGNDMKKLFTKFYRTKNSLGIAGTGIGLYLVKQFVDLHGGEITVDSEDNKGSCFTVYLPLEN